MAFAFVLCDDQMAASATNFSCAADVRIQIQFQCDSWLGHFGAMTILSINPCVETMTLLSVNRFFKHLWSTLWLILWLLYDCVEHESLGKTHENQKSNFFSVYVWHTERFIRNKVCKWFLCKILLSKTKTFRQDDGSQICFLHTIGIAE